MGLDTRMRLARLYLCTDLRRDQGDLEEFLRAAFAGGVDLIQLRDKHASRDELLAALALARKVAAPVQGLVVVNDDPGLAAEFRSDVLHVGQDDAAPQTARPSLHQWAHIGLSTHSEAQVRGALADADVDYFCVGPVYATPTKPDYPPVGLELVRYAAQQSPVADIDAKPWWAIGGIDIHTIDAVLAAGARRVVVVRAITQAPDPQAAAQALRDKLDAAWHTPELERYVFAAVGNRSKLGRGLSH